ncbi:MAG: class I SAM-dependent methyltransferase [Mycobacteriales bacterium]
MGADELAAPVVDSREYDEAYYLTCCAGYEAWAASGGARFAGVYAGALARAKLAPGEVVVDIGTGRGELLVVAVQQGAKRAVGVEYSAAGVALARKTIAAHAVGECAEVILADARSIPVADGSADLVTLLDVVEHLSPGELAATLVEARRILRPGGRVFIHTFPTRTIYEVTYRLQRLARPGRRSGWPVDPRNDYEHRMHVNEQTRARLRASLRRAGFARVEVVLGGWVYTDHVPEESAKRLYHRLARFAPTASLGVANLFATAFK